jgi:hypothetical protein
MLVWCQLVIEFSDWQLVRIARCWIRLSLLTLQDQSSLVDSKQWPLGELLMACLPLATQLQNIEQMRKKGIIYVEQELYDELFKQIQQTLTVTMTIVDNCAPTNKCTLASTLVWLLLGAWPTWHTITTMSTDTRYTCTAAWMLVPIGVPMNSPSNNLHAVTRQLIRDIAHFVQRKCGLSESI